MLVKIKDEKLKRENYAIVLDDVHGGDFSKVTINDPSKSKKQIIEFQSSDITK